MEDPRAFGCVPTDDDGRVTAFLEKTPDPVTDQINAGCYVFRRAVIEQIPAGRPVSVERETFPGLLAERRAGRRATSSRRTGATSGRRPTSCAAPPTWCGASRPPPALPGPPGDALVLAGATVADGRGRSAAPTVGAGCVVGGGRASGRLGAVRRRPGRRPGAVVRAQHRRPRRHRRPPARCCEDAVIGDGAYIGAGNELRRGARVWPGVRLGRRRVRFSSDV